MNLKVILRSIIEIFSFPIAILLSKRKRAIIFLFHEVSDTPSQFAIDNDLYISTEIFRKQVSWIKSYFNVVKPDQLLQENGRGASAMITFDDGSESIFKHAAPILAEHKLFATVFINMGPVKGELFWSGKIAYLFKYDTLFRKSVQKKYGKDAFLYCTQQDIDKWSQLHNEANFEDKVKSYYGRFVSIEQLEESCERNIFLGNHLYNHFNAAAISEEELTIQYLKNVKTLSQFDNFVNIFSYPFGQPNTCYNKETDDLIKKLGTSMIFSAYPMFNQHSKLTKKMHRIAFNNNDNNIFRLFFRTFIRPLFNKYFHYFKYI